MTMADHIKMLRSFFIVGILFNGCKSDVKCRDDTGTEVDWYILYKLPNKDGKGLSYLYMDESTRGWTLSREKINSKSGTLANTLKPLMDFYDSETAGFGFMLYSDQPPPPYVAPSSFGHSKGVVMLDKQSGIWLSHSTPKFPTYRSKDFWPSSGNENAQTFMCVTYPYDQFREIGLQLMYIHAYSYDSDIPKTFFNELRCVAQRSCYPKETPWYREHTLTSMRGRHFYSFAKYKRFMDDLYSGLVVSRLDQPLMVKSWGKMRNPLPSNCSDSIPHPVYNVLTVKLNGESYDDTVDHSKWCVTRSREQACIADMNREVSQMSRGGGAICMTDVSVGRAFYRLISQYAACKHPREDQRREL
ncbi:deoxyribonuclease-2-alpha-like isoform X2 [Cheilinus undulatus]|uniref:deoxyribonuclease-2-alpha-like isoform X2 n=1 Tax=Cheilinus undulatus TaxID=241271 RepID=UPI001BD6DAF2|nr:deoxyribonuclease-2-alpha-like isoform X2 [Cheilinus undulatus]